MNTTGNRPTTGNLVIVHPNGKREVLENDKPFALLQYLKRRYTVPRGGKLKITYNKHLF